MTGGRASRQQVKKDGEERKGVVCMGKQSGGQYITHVQ